MAIAGELLKWPTPTHVQLFSHNSCRRRSCVVVPSSVRSLGTVASMAEQVNAYVSLNESIDSQVYAGSRHVLTAVREEVLSE